ncbi:MAG: PTS glucose transporter subunit IIA [Actinomycetales bacterium]|jgi:PTS system N-acetylglucosamine-specific IIA component|nr:PTS glucose transporter subunit IIA [Actinomycetales bacterium]
MPELTVRAPVAGVVVAMADVPDPVFGAQLVGPGVAIDPVRDGDVDVVAPIDGTLVKVHPHAFVVAASDGRAALVHLGLDTVQLGGEGFTLRAAEGDAVRAGDVVVTWRPADVEAGGRSPVCPVVALDAPAEQVAAVPAVGARVGAGEPLLTWR